MNRLDDLQKSIIAMEKERAKELTRAALDEGLAAEKILNEGLIPAMEQVGKDYEEGRKFIPEILMAAKTMMGSLELLKPLLIGSEGSVVGKAVLGTVEGDVHDIGVKLVGMMLEGAGFEVIVLGADTSTDEFIEATRKHNPDILGLSALLTTTMPRMQDVIQALAENGLRDKVKVMVGGATLNQRYADEFGADAYAPDAAQASALAKQLIGSIQSSRQES